MKNYKFIGHPDTIFPFLVHGQVYPLEIEVVHGKDGSGPFPTIVDPFVCPYRSWATFFQNWEEEDRTKK